MRRSRQKKRLCAALAGERDAALRELQSLHADERLLEQSEPVRELLSGKATYVADRAAIARLEAAASRPSARASAPPCPSLAGTGRRRKLLSLDRSLFAREEIERRRQALEDLRVGRVNAENSFAARKEDFDAAVRDEEEAGKELERTPAAEREADEETIAQLQKGRDQFASTVADLPGVRKEREKERERLKDAIREISADWARGGDRLIRLFHSGAGKSPDLRADLCRPGRRGPKSGSADRRGIQGPGGRARDGRAEDP